MFVHIDVVIHVSVRQFPGNSELVKVIIDEFVGFFTNELRVPTVQCTKIC